MNISLDGLRAIVCGASQGMGKAIALQFAKSGASVFLIARNEENLKKTIASLPQNSTQHHSYSCVDMTNLSKLETIVETASNEYGGFHIVVNNTGGPPPGLLYQSENNELEIAFKQHILSAQTILRIILPKMIELKYGRIINIISVGLKQPIENLGVSNTIRGAMGSWAKTLSKELATYGITINNILPGYINTERLKYLIQANSLAKNITYEEEERNFIERIPAKRLGNPEEIGYLATFIASPFASYLNGTSIPLDGGFLSCL
jgi:3-oxoacyl-[acyl-carrier protein] reductase